MLYILVWCLMILLRGYGGDLMFIDYYVEGGE